MEKFIKIWNEKLSIAIKSEKVLSINLLVCSILFFNQLPKSYACYQYYSILFKPVKFWMKRVYRKLDQNGKPNSIDHSYKELFAQKIPVKLPISTPISVLFLITHYAVIEHQLALANQLKNSGVCNVLIIDATDPGEIRRQVDLKDFFSGFQIIKWNSSIFTENMGLVVLQYPYSQMIKNFIDLNKIATVVFGYGPNIASSKLYRGKLRTEYSFPLYHQVSLIGSHNKKEAKLLRKSGVNKNKIFISGDPLAWTSLSTPFAGGYFNNKYKDQLFDFLWAPHHSKTGHFEDRPGYSNFERDLLYLYKFAKSTDFSFLIRPHALTLQQIYTTTSKYAISDDSSEIWFNLINLRNVNVSENISMIQDLKSSKCVITDGSSIIGYGMLLGKPIILSTRSSHIGFKKIYKKYLKFQGEFSSEKEFFEACSYVDREKKYENFGINKLLLNRVHSPGDLLIKKILEN